MESIMTYNNFTFSKIPKIHFGVGKLQMLPNLIKEKGDTVLIVLGGSSFKKTAYYIDLYEHLKKAGIRIFEEAVNSEPSPNLVDKIVNIYRDENISVVVSIGGGSVLDAGKAISAMLTKEGSVKDYLEGFETKKHDGAKVPFIAIPTSSGTGSEATKNAVLSNIGVDGFKKSLRHDNFIPDVALLDPTLTLSCPKNVTASCGLDAFTQLLESYVSTEASPITDSLAYRGMLSFKEGFLAAYHDGTDLEARTKLSYASLISGITLANAGLGVVHGFASSIGSYYEIPHGVVCGTLLAEATKLTIDSLFKDKEANLIYLSKYANVGALISDSKSDDMIKNCEALIETIEAWTTLTHIPRLSDFGVCESHFDKIIKDTSNKNNPIKLNKNELLCILKNRL